MKATEYKWTIRLTLLTPILALLSLFLMGGGHGWYAPAIFLFPTGMVNLIWENQLSTAFLKLGLVQYPLYGLLIDKAGSLKLRNKRAAIIIMAQLVLAILVISLQSSDFR